MEGLKNVKTFKLLSNIKASTFKQANSDVDALQCILEHSIFTIAYMSGASAVERKADRGITCVQERFNGCSGNERL